MTGHSLLNAVVASVTVSLVVVPIIIIWHRYGAPRVVSWLKRRHEPWREFERKQK